MLTYNDIFNITSLKYRKRVTPVTITQDKDKILLKFPYNAELKDFVKIAFSNARWNPENKAWAARLDARTRFQLDYLTEGNLIKRYDNPPIKFPSNREELFPHQYNMYNQCLTCRRVFWLVDMGAGKTLAAISIMEHIYANETKGPFLVACPKNVMKEWGRELKKWKSKVSPTIVSIDSLEKYITSMAFPPPFLLIDEGSKIKTYTTNRWTNAYNLTNLMDKHYLDNAYVIVMTGTATPKDYRDIWAQAEVACPGFIKEKSYRDFAKRIATFKKEQGPYGQFDKLISFKDGTCSLCNEPEKNHVNSVNNCVFTPKVKCMICDEYHTANYTCGFFEPSTTPVNEIERLARSMDGFAISLKKSDCLKLPGKVYEEIICEPTEDMLRAAELVAAQEETTIGVLGKLRQFSDGFLYVDDSNTDYYNDQYTTMPENPKLDALVELMESLEDANQDRIVIYAGFKAAISMISNMCIERGWNVIAVDSRGWRAKRAEPILIEPSAAYFCDAPIGTKIAFVAHPASAGMGLNLQRANVFVYYSNSFNGEDRIQSEERGNRPGQVNIVRIIDLICLGTDRLILNNISKKKDMNNLIMSEVKSAIRER